MTAYLGAIWKCRFFWLSLVKMDLVSRYRGSILGLCWSLLNPICMTLILCVVFKYAFKMPNMRSFAPFVFTGLTFWGFFSSTLTMGCGCFFQGESYIRQYPAPMAIYPLRTVLGSAFHFLIGLSLAIFIALLVGPADPEELSGAAAGRKHPAAHVQETNIETPTTFCQANAADPVSRWQQLSALPTLVPTLLLLFLFAWSVAILFGLLNVRFRDTRHLAEIGLQGLFYLTPILYPIGMMKGRLLGKLLYFNPLTTILDLLIQPILYGKIPSAATYLTAVLIVAVLAAAAILALKFEERRLIFHL